MIGKLTGTIDVVGEAYVLIDVGGVGYEVSCSSRTLRLLKVGERASLAIDMHVREDAHKLYGFTSELERAWFRLLQTVQGVGAKVALSALGTLGPQGLVNALATQNWQAVEETPGVGKKLAQRIVAELRDKAPAGSGTPVLNSGGAGRIPDAGAAPLSSASGEAISALTNLGYQPAQASSAVAAALKELGGDADTAKLIRRGLKELAR